MPKIMGSSLEEHRQTTRRAVFDALSALMNEKTFDAISMADIAAGAGIGRTAIYNHFRDKEAIVVAFATEETDRYLARLRSVLEGIDSPVERLRTYVRHHIETSDEFHFGLGSDLYRLLSRESLVEIRRHVVAVEDSLTEILVAGRDAGDFDFGDLSEVGSIIQSVLSARGASIGEAQCFVLRGVGAAGV